MKAKLDSITISLPFPPSTNHYWRHTVVRGRPRTLISAPGRAYRDEVGTLIAIDHRALTPLTGPLRSTVALYPPDKRHRDLDNFAGKALYDALQWAGVYENDSQIKESHHYMHEPCQGGLCTVILECI